ncbi:glucose-6-phosphate isomerase [Sulfurimonas sp.]|uniref:glucose-6-phosphate isomerase n=1 Tax=Sulfurimonas sp. TaxID=2022749 RepID=UPI00260867CC|nr:glucose-6-phosphate isomerase [Sulfurimonas sp.]
MTYAHNFNPTISDETVFQAILDEKDDIGYYNLPFQDTTAFKEYAKTVQQNNIVVIGIGGSSLGTYAIYKFLKHSKNLQKKLFFLETTDPIDIQSKIQMIDLKDTLFIVISKSGTTVETVSIFKYINSLIKCDKNNTVVITENDSKLNTYAKMHGMTAFEIPKNVGGRFSVFSAVGLLPLAIVGIDIDELMRGTKRIYDGFFSANKTAIKERLLNKARFLVEYKNKFNINVIFSYSSRLEGFNKWYIQLWGESLGKIDVNGSRAGLTPVGIIGPIDQHSFLQLIIEGRRDKTVTVIKVENFENDLQIPDITLEGLEELDYLNNMEFSSLIKNQADATIESINNLKDIPCDVMTIDGVCETAISSLMYEYELLTSLCAKFMYIDAYNQPGVESGKIILKKKLQGK